MDITRCTITLQHAIHSPLELCISTWQLCPWNIKKMFIAKKHAESTWLPTLTSDLQKVTDQIEAKWKLKGACYRAELKHCITTLGKGSCNQGDRVVSTVSYQVWQYFCSHSEKNPHFVPLYLGPHSTLNFHQRGGRLWNVLQVSVPVSA